MRHVTLPAAALAAALIASPAAAVVTFKSASFTAQAQTASSPVAEGTATVNSLPTSPFGQTKSVSDDDGYARADGFADFDDETSGFTLLNQADVAGYYLPGKDASGGTARVTFAYTFAVDREYILRLDAMSFYYAPRDDVAVHDYDAYWKVLDGNGQSVLGGGFKPMGPDLVFTAGFGPGTYTLELGAFAYTLATPQDHNSAVELDSHIRFKLIPNARGPASPTPEPATWTLMIGGFGLAGASLRRAQRQTSSRSV